MIVECLKYINPYIRLNQQSQESVALHYEKRVTDPSVFCNVTQHSSVFAAKSMYIFCSHRVTSQGIMSRLAYVTLCSWRRHGCIKSYPLRKKIQKKYEKLKTSRACCDISIEWNISDLITYISISKKFSIEHYHLHIHWPNRKSLSLLLMRKNQELVVSSHWAHCEFTVIKTQSHDLNVRSPWPKYSLRAHCDNLFSRGISTQIQFFMSPLLPHWLWPFG